MALLPPLPVGWRAGAGGKAGTGPARLPRAGIHACGVSADAAGCGLPRRLRQAPFLSLLCLLLAAGFLKLAAETTSIIEGMVLDSQGLAIAGAEITLSGPMLASGTKAASDATGRYRVPGLPAGTYTLRVAKPGFAAQVFEALTVTVNRVLIFDAVLAVGALQEEITVSATPPVLEAAISSSGATILPQQIEQMPINGRNYLDLMQLVPGVSVNQRADAGTDAAVPILGERGGNAIFLIDGMPNSNALDGGPAAPFHQDVAWLNRGKLLQNLQDLFVLDQSAAPVPGFSKQIARVSQADRHSHSSLNVIRIRLHQAFIDRSGLGVVFKCTLFIG